MKVKKIYKKQNLLQLIGDPISNDHKHPGQLNISKMNSTQATMMKNTTLVKKTISIIQKNLQKDQSDLRKMEKQTPIVNLLKIFKALLVTENYIAKSLKTIIITMKVVF